MRVGEELLAWAALTRTPRLDAATLSAALGIFGTALGITAASEASLARAGLPAPARDYLLRAPPRAKCPCAAAERTWLNHPRHHLVPFTDPRYPPLLRVAANCPIALYVAGDPQILCDPQLAVVGARNPTAQGRDTAFDLAAQLAVRGLAITSGLAEARESPSPCWARERTSFIPEQPRLAREIEQNGALVERISLGHSPSAREFSPAKPYHRRLEPGDIGGRSRAAQRILDHRPAGGRTGPGAVCDTRVDPQSL